MHLPQILSPEVGKTPKLAIAVDSGREGDVGVFEALFSAEGAQAETLKVSVAVDGTELVETAPFSLIANAEETPLPQKQRDAKVLVSIVSLAASPPDASDAPAAEDKVVAAPIGPTGLRTLPSPETVPVAAKPGEPGKAANEIPTMPAKGKAQVDPPSTPAKADTKPVEPQINGQDVRPPQIVAPVPGNPVEKTNLRPISQPEHQAER